MNYETVGAGPGAIILLHGIGTSLRTWDTIRNRFDPDRYTLHLFDLKGFGLSSKPRPADYSVKEQANIVIDFAEKLNLKNIILIGNSYGGGVALMTDVLLSESDHGLVVDKLILIDPAAYRENAPFALKLIKNPFLSWIAVKGLSILPATFFARFSLRHLFYDPKKVTGQVVDRNAVSLSQKGAAWSFIEAARQIVPDDYEAFVKRYEHINSPTLIIWGKHDPIITLKHGQRLQRAIPGSRLEVIDKCGHVPQEEYPEETFRLISEFIDHP